MKNIYVKTIVCLTFLMGVVAQAQTVSGLVTSDDGPLPGATIVVKGTNNGTTADWSLALPDVNIIRARSGAAALTSIDADEFLAERGREMFQESTRRSDQIRFGQYVAGSDSGKGTTVSPAHKNVMPIPLDAINTANGTLTQNQGY